MTKSETSQSTETPRDTFIPAYEQPYTTTTLSKRDAKKFKEALEQEEPNENLKEAVRAHNEMLSSSDKL